MHDVVAGQHLEGFDYLPQKLEGFLFGKGSFSLQQLIKGPSVAEFVDEIEVVGSFEHVDVLDDEGTGLQSRQDVDLVDRAFL